MKIENIKLEHIRIDCGTQSREKENQEQIDNIAEAITNGEEIDPAVIFDDGKHFYLADGFHRYHAHLKQGQAIMPCVRQLGTLRDAQIYAFQEANKLQKSLPRSHADKRRCVNWCLDDLEYQDLSDREIARMLSVSHVLVSRMRKERMTPKEVKPAKRKNVVEPEVELLPPFKVELLPAANDMDAEAMTYLQEENQRLEKQLAVVAMDATPEEKALAKTMIEELQEEVKMLRIENQSLKISRDTYQAENAQLIKQVGMLQRQLKKAA
jgi:hypothetical protein